jgi:F0F1-type ATP synthase membrane subunit b/b'
MEANVPNILLVVLLLAFLLRGVDWGRLLYKQGASLIQDLQGAEKIHGEARISFSRLKADMDQWPQEHQEAVSKTDKAIQRLKDGLSAEGDLKRSRLSEQYQKLEAQETRLYREKLLAEFSGDVLQDARQRLIHSLDESKHQDLIRQGMERLRRREGVSS